MAVAHRVAQGEAHAHRRPAVGSAPPGEDVGDRPDQARLKQTDTDDEHQNRALPGGKAEQRQAGKEGERVDHAASHQAGWLPHAPADNGGGVDMGGRVRRGHGRHQREENRQEHRQRERPPGDDADAQARPHADADHGGRGQGGRKKRRVDADDDTVGNSEPASVRAVAAVRNDHGGCAHHRALSDGVQRRDQQDHLREDQEDTRNEEKVLAGVRTTSVLGYLVLFEARGEHRGVGRARQHLARQDREAGRVELTDLFPGDGHRSDHVPGRLRAPRDGKAIDGKRSVADNGALGATDDRIDNDGSLKGLRRAFLSDRQGQVDAVSDRDRERSGNILRNNGVAGGQGPGLASSIDTRSFERGRLRAVVNREARALSRFQTQLVESVNGDQMVACWHPAVEGLHRDRYLVARGRRRQTIDRKVLFEGARGAMQRHRLHVAAVSEPRRGMVALRGRHIPEGDRRDRDNDRQRDQKHRRERAPQALARITRGDAEYYSPSPHPCVEPAH